MHLHLDFQNVKESIGHRQSHLHHFEILHCSLHDIQLHGNHCLCNQPLFSTTPWSSGCNTSACGHTKCLCSLLAHSDPVKMLRFCCLHGPILSSKGRRLYACADTNHMQFYRSGLVKMALSLGDFYGRTPARRPLSRELNLSSQSHCSSYQPNKSLTQIIYKFSFLMMTLSRRLILSRATGQQRLPHPRLIADTDITQQRGIHHVVCLCQPHSRRLHLLISLVCYKNSKVFFKNFSVNSNS